MSITAVILTKNEEDNIKDCIDSLSFCEEVIVVDDYSTDDTENIATEKGALVLKRNLNGDFSKQRNYGLKKASCNWVLFVDADERVTNRLKIEILKETGKKKGKYMGFYIKRKDIVFGKELLHGENSSLYFLRLGRKDAGKWKRIVHEEWEINKDIKKLKNVLIHYPHMSIRSFVNKINYYSFLHAKAKIAEGSKSSLIKIVVFPLLKFFNNYIFRLGFLDGTAGFIVALMMSFHSYLAWSKLWIYQKHL